MATRYRPCWNCYTSISREKLTSEKIDKNEIGREKFIEKVWEWKEQYGDIIFNQLKKLGCSCDWSRNAFTMDENCLLYTSPSPRDATLSRMPSSA